MNKSSETWVKNMCQKLEGICTDIDELVCKEPVSFVGNRMETVGANVKNFFSSFVDDFGLTQGTEVKENTVDSNIDNPKEAPLVPEALCHKPSSTDLRCLEQITSEVSQQLIDEKGILVNNNTQVEIDSSTNSQNLDNRFEEGFLCDKSVHSDATEFEYADWGIENIIDLNLDNNNMIKREPLMNFEENKTLPNRCIDLECDSNTSTTHQSSDVLSSSCGSFTTISCDSTNEAYVSCSGTVLADGSMVDFEDIKYDTVESGVKLSLFPTTSRSKSYKKMIQDAFMSRKRLAKEYKQLAIWYGDIDKELCQPIESSKSPAQCLPDSEWELL